MRLTINVTQADIDSGCDCAHLCPVAQAVTRALHEVGRLSYHAESDAYAAFREGNGLEIYDGDRWGGDELVCTVPPPDCSGEALEFAMEFDSWYRFQNNYGGDEDEYERETGHFSPGGPPAPFAFEIELPLPE